MPWVVHFHAWVMMAWVGLYLAQNFLVFSDNVALHRRLGWLSVILVPAILVMGAVITRWTMQTRRRPAVLRPEPVPVQQSAAAVRLGALAAWAVTIRKNTGWHRRLMFCAFAMLTGPGRRPLLPSPLLHSLCVVPRSRSCRRCCSRRSGCWPTSAATARCTRPGCGASASPRPPARRRPRRLQRLGHAFTQAFVAGTPGAERSMEAFFPPM